MKHKIRTGLFASIGMLFMILDTKTAIAGAQEGVTLCLMTVIPSLLPFFMLSILLTGSVSGIQSKLLSPISRLCRIPQGSESIFLIGLLGGYPAGAQAVADCFASGQLRKEDARRMLGFCSNAGPSFLFGIVASVFSQRSSPWLLWLIHIFSALAVGMLLPGGSNRGTILSQQKNVTVPEALTISVKIMAKVCGWIIVFRVILAFFNRWFLWMFPTTIRVVIFGIAELTVGCTSLSVIQCEGLRFVLAAAFLGFGGICITMQTVSVTEKSGCGMYIPGKLLQCLLSVLLAAVVQSLFLQDSFPLHPAFYALGLAFTALGVYILGKFEKRYSNCVAVDV